MLYRIIIKPLVDKLFSFVGLLLLSPVFVVVSIAIKSSSTGPVFFKQTRAGKNMRLFQIYKFRTMYVDTDPNGQSPTTIEDSRVTPLGRFLRKTSLDELPQLINVIRGEMSLVGPRPLLTWQAEQFNEFEAQRLDVKPGITGLAQVNGRGNLAWDEKIEYDVRYVRSVSFLLDLCILARTVVNVAKLRDINETPKGAWKSGND